MAETRQDLDALLALAVDRSLESRERLAAEIGDLCDGQNKVLTEQERDLVFEILKKLLYDFEIPLRAKLSKRFASSSNIPRDLIVTLANDDIEVARPLLLASPLLRDPDLIDIIRHRGQQHQVTIARRHDLSEAVSESLVETEDEDVIRTLLQNQEAAISEATMAYLVEQSRRIDSFQEPLVNRKDLPKPLAKKLYWWVAAALRQQLLADFDIAPSELDDALEEAVSAQSGEDLAAVAQNGAEGLAGVLAARGQITPDVLIQVLRKGEIPLFEALLAQISGIDSRRLAHIIYEPSGDRMAIICKALEIPKQIFATIFMLTRDGSRVLKPSELSRATRVFDRVSPESAGEILASWQRPEAFQKAVELLAARGAAGGGRK